MTGQLLPLRLLTSSRSLLSSRGALAFRFKTLSLSSKQATLTFSIQNSGGRCFSSRPPRGRDSGRSGFRSAAAGGGQAKSLVEDEAELSDWVSDLKTDSFKFRLSGSEDEDEERDSKRGGKRNGRDDRVRAAVSSGFSDRRSRDSRGSLSKRGLDIGVEEDGHEDDDWRGSRGSNGVGKPRGSGGFSDRNSRGAGGFSERNPRGSGGFSERNSRGSGGLSGRNSRGAGGFSERNPRGAGGFSERNSRGSGGLSERNSRGTGGFSEGNSRGSGGLSERNSRGTGGFSERNSRGSGGLSERNSRGSVSKRRFGSDLEDEDEEDEKEEFLSRQRGRGQSSLSSSKRGGRNEQSSYKQGSKSLRAMSEEEEEEEDEDEDDAFGSDDDFFGDKLDKKKVSSKDSLLESLSSVESGDDSSEQPVSRSSLEDKESYLSNTRFDQCVLSPLTLKGVKAAGYERMTLVQEATLPVILKGKDVLAKAKTGTGKTVAFLLPAIEIVSKLPAVDRDQKRPPINVLVVCPTRELADQAATEANALLKFHPSLGVQVVIGGTRLALEQKRMQANPCQILVATPGRLRDHIENTPGFATRLTGVKVLVLDEADRLLDMGFRKDIEKIVAAVPKQRQTLLFSATVPDEVRQICYIAMKRDHEFVNTVAEGSEETHSQVRQMHLTAPLEKQFSILYGLLTDHIADNADYKVIVFCTTAMITKLVADLLSELRLNVREIHSRKPQSYRTRVSKEFKESKGLILVSSDVSARGVDYPDVTLVIQVGVPADREQYIHRLGRTGRKGKEGQGVLLLAPWEEFFLSSVKDLPMTKAPVPIIDPDTRKKVERALGHVEMKNKESAYQAWLGYYNSNKMIGRDKSKLVLLANEFSRSMGLDDPPAIAKLVLRKMGLNNVPGLRAK